MQKQIIQLSVLTFIAGMFCKIYDDLNDNDLYTGTVFFKNKDYINEFLKGMHYLLLGYTSYNYIYPMMLVTVLNVLLFVSDSKAFELPYEFSGLITFVLFTIFLVINNLSELKSILNYNIIFMVIAYMGLTHLFDTLLFKNVEFGYKKLAVRGVSSVLMISLLTMNYKFKMLPDELMYCLWYPIGYCVTSCFFQIFLIYKSTNATKTESVNEPEPVKEPVKEPETVKQNN
jgi:hypothetical protein